MRAAGDPSTCMQGFPLHSVMDQGAGRAPRRSVAPRRLVWWASHTPAARRGGVPRRANGNGAAPRGAAPFPCVSRSPGYSPAGGNSRSKKKRVPQSGAVS